MPSRVSLLLILLVPLEAAAAELTSEMVDAYEQYIARVEAGFAQAAPDDLWLEEVPTDSQSRLRDGEIMARPGSEDGIVDVSDGLIHHWRGTAFIPDVTLESVLAVVRNYPAYPRIYDWVIGGNVIWRERDDAAGRDWYWTLLRIKRSAGIVTSTVDLWTFVEYRHLNGGVVTSASNADCVRQVEGAGGKHERRLPVGEGSGYLWRANTYASYRERDGGVYIDLQTVGLSRGFPPLLGWLIEPIARDLGRGSVAETLRQLRSAVLDPAQRDQGASDGTAELSETVWCEDDAAHAARAERP